MASKGQKFKKYSNNLKKENKTSIQENIHENIQDKKLVNIKFIIYNDNRGDTQNGRNNYRNINLCYHIFNRIWHHKTYI